VIAEDVGVFVVGGGDALLVLHLVTVTSWSRSARQLELLGFGGGFHALRQRCSSSGRPSRKSCTSRTACL
jgi:hypothetical protein